MVQEMLYRERRRTIAGNIYLGQLTASGLKLQWGLFDAWTSLYVDEVSHDNYRPKVVAEKRKILDVFAQRRFVEKDRVRRINEYTITTAKQMMPYTREELEVRRARLRKREFDRAAGTQP